MKRFAFPLAASLLLVSVPIWAQDGSSSSGQPAPTTLDLPQLYTTNGLSPTATAEINDHETLAMGSGAVSFSLPIVSLPQLGGRSLSIGFVYQSNQYALKETTNSFSIAEADSENETLQPTNKTISWQKDPNTPWFAGSVHANLPTLSAELTFAGVDLYQETGAAGYAVNMVGPEYCTQNWVFTDWNGSTHSFPFWRDCTTPTDQWSAGASVLQHKIVSSVDDGSYALDASEANDIKVFAKDGVVYHFTTYQLPPQSPTRGDTQDLTNTNFYSAVFNSMVDPNGNTVTVTKNGSAGSWSLQDTVGRQVTVGQGGATISYPYQASAQATPATVTASVSAGSGGGSQGWPYGTVNPCLAPPPSNVPTIPQQSLYYYAPSSVPLTTSSVITLQNGLQYTLTFDGLGHLTEVQYPAGGYTRYDYQTVYEPTQDFGDVQCTTPEWAVIAKHVCTAASGSCGQQTVYADQTQCVAGVTAGGEQTTCYGGDYYYGKWGALDETDSLGNRTHYAFEGGDGGPIFVAPAEVERDVYQGSSTLLRTIKTSYTGPNCPSPVGVLFPCQVSTTYNDVSPALTKTVNTQYDAASNIGNPTQVQEADFSGNVIRTTTTSWNDSGIYADTALYSNQPPPTSYPAHILDHVASVTTTDNTSGIQRSTTYTYDAVGNFSSKTVAGTATASAVTHYSVDAQGNLTKVVDPLGYTTLAGYGSPSINRCPSSANMGRPTSVTNALNQTTYLSYYPDGSAACSQDLNGTVTTVSLDPIGRETGKTVTGSNGTVAFAETYTYQPSAPLTSTHMVQNIVTDTVPDGLGRLSQQIMHAPEGLDCTETFYDAVGNVDAVNDPRVGCNGAVAGGSSVLYAHDALGRTTVQTNEDGSAKQWQFSGTTTIAVDESGNTVQRTDDALGRLTQVLEPNASGADTLATNYTYNGFDDLVSVQQIGASGETSRGRGFSYDALSRLLTAQNPETGTICYGTWQSQNGSTSCQTGYDLDGNLKSKTDGRGLLTTFNYDALNRLVAKHAASAQGGGAGLSTCFLYDSNGGSSSIYGIGHLNAEWTQSAACPQQSTMPASGIITSKVIASYDPMGRVLTEMTCTWVGCSQPHTQTYTYDLPGHLTGYTDALGATSFNQQYDTAGRLIGLTSTPAGGATLNLFNITSYSPVGWTAATMGGNTSSSPVVNIGQSFDNRMRLASHTVTATGVSQ